MVGFSGTSPSAALLSSVRRGEVGSVILFASNLESRSQTLALTSALQRAARAGGNPRLLISTDQEGGQVKRLPAGPPDRSPPQMVATGNVATGSAEGHATGVLLRRWGINVDLAPVADVPTSWAAFIWRQGRAFSFNASTVAKYATAFAFGLQARGVAATAKHFPGLGSAISNTDFTREELMRQAQTCSKSYWIVLQPQVRFRPESVSANSVCKWEHGAILSKLRECLSGREHIVTGNRTGNVA